MKDLKKLLNESLFDVDDNMKEMDNVTMFGNMYKVSLYTVDYTTKLSKIASLSAVKKASESLGYLENKEYYKGLSKIGAGPRGIGITRQRNIFMIPMCNILAHVQYDKNNEIFKRNILSLFTKYGLGDVEVRVETHESRPKLLKENDMMIVLMNTTEIGISPSVIIRYVKQ